MADQNILLRSGDTTIDVTPSVEDVVVKFDGTSVLTPRGRYNVELYLSFFRLRGQVMDFEIQYSSICRIFVLPKSKTPHTFVVVTVDTPIRKGQTLYHHIVLQFETDLVFECQLSMNSDLFTTPKYKDRLEPSYKGVIPDVFSKILRGLSGARITRPGKFRSRRNGYTVESEFENIDGVLYPIERGFFFLPKPPTLILHDEIDYVEFERRVVGGVNLPCFDFVVTMKNDKVHVFRHIPKREYDNFFEYVRGKGLKVMAVGVGADGGVILVPLGSESEYDDDDVDQVEYDDDAVDLHDPDEKE